MPLRCHRNEIMFHGTGDRQYQTKHPLAFPTIERSRASYNKYYAGTNMESANK